MLTRYIFIITITSIRITLIANYKTFTFLALTKHKPVWTTVQISWSVEIKIILGIINFEKFNFIYLPRKHWRLNLKFQLEALGYPDNCTNSTFVIIFWEVPYYFSQVTKVNPIKLNCPTHGITHLISERTQHSQS